MQPQRGCGNLSCILCQRYGLQESIRYGFHVALYGVFGVRRFVDLVRINTNEYHVVTELYCDINRCALLSAKTRNENTPPDDQGEWATATKKKKQPSQHQRGGGPGGYSNGPGGYANGARGMDDRRGGRGGMGDKMRGVSYRIIGPLTRMALLLCCIISSERGKAKRASKAIL